MTIRTRTSTVVAAAASFTLLVGGAISCMPEHAQQPPKPVSATDIQPTPAVAIAPERAATQPTTRATTQAAAAVRSPEIAPDNRVTFRVQLPRDVKAAQVIHMSLTGNKTLEMAKGTNNVWSVTTPPLEPDLYE